MPRKIFVNLAVQDLEKTVEFFTRLGFAFNPQFTDDNAACMIINEDAAVMLLVHRRFRNFTKKATCDSTTHTEAILTVTAENRQKVNDLVRQALAAGGTPANDPMDYGSMYGHSFYDPDGHLWEVLWMDRGAMQK